MGFQYWGIWGFWPQNGGLKGDPKVGEFGGFDPKMGDPKIAQNWCFLTQNWGPEMEPEMGFQYWGIWGFWTQNGGREGDPKIEGFGGFDPKTRDPKICPKLAFFAPKRSVSSHSLAELSVKPMGGAL